MLTLSTVFLGNSMNNLLSYCGLTDTRMRASEKDLPVPLGRDTFYCSYSTEFKLEI